MNARHALIALGDAPSEHIPAIIDALDDKGSAGAAAKLALRAIGADAVPLLRSGLDHRRAKVRKKAQQVLENIEADLAPSVLCQRR